MKLIDRYIYVATKRLPKDSREIVSKELRTNIDNMLPENPDESDVIAVLEKLGNPVKHTNEYPIEKKYLIGPNVYDSYFSVLKLVIVVLTIVLASIALLNKLFTSSSDIGLFEMLIEIFVSMIITLIQGITQAFLWVTLTFIVLEKIGVKEDDLPFSKKEWSINDLPSLPIIDKKKISRGETIFSMLFTVFFTALLYLKPQLIGWYEKGSNGLTLIEPLFVLERLQSYIFVIILLAIFQLSIFIYKFISKQWSILLAIVNTAHNIALSILVYVIVSDTSLLNKEFLLRFASLIGASFSEFTSMWSRSIWIFVAVFIGICIWDSIDGFIKSKT